MREWCFHERMDCTWPQTMPFTWTAGSTFLSRTSFKASHCPYWLSSLPQCILVPCVLQVFWLTVYSGTQPALTTIWATVSRLDRIMRVTASPIRPYWIMRATTCMFTVGVCCIRLLLSDRKHNGPTKEMTCASAQTHTVIATLHYLPDARGCNDAAAREY